MVDTRQLGRQPGSMRTVNRIVAVPDAFATAMASVPEGSEIELDLRLEAVMEGVLVTGTVRGQLTAECSRCLDLLSDDMEAGFQEMYRYTADEDTKVPGADEDAADKDEDYYLEGDLLDLEPVVRDAVVLALPLSPLCGPDCPGLCSECGAKLAEAGPDHGHGDNVDPRWEALRTIADDPGER
ncbi:YceD family protein [Nocardiopsis sp. NPDC058631]|uniref:YceD family protein n=1 Tax=Nocardiopsis sp. NPDC058631 TaxID=3346566 RepID=UPI0036668CED